MTQRSYKMMARVCQRALMATGLLAVSIAAMSADLFEEEKLRSLNLEDPITASDTLGGYAIYPGDGKWQFVNGKDSRSTLLGGGDAEKRIGVALGTIQMDQKEGTTLFARQILKANLSRGNAPTWVGSPCSPNHLVLRNKGQGREDGCMTIDPVIINLGSTPTVFLEIVLTNTAGSGRYYRSALLLNTALLGVRDTVRSDWTPEVLAARPQLRMFLDRLTVWAEALQDSSIKAFGYDQPQDAYVGLQSFRTLLPVPAALADKKHSLAFLSAVEDIKYKKGFAALAYSQFGDNKTRWGNSWGQESQMDADKNALKNCENGRPFAAPPCTLYPFQPLSQ